MKADKPNPNSNSNPNSKKLIFLSMEGKKTFYGELDIYLFHEILCNFKKSILVSQKSSFNKGGYIIYQIII